MTPLDEAQLRDKLRKACRAAGSQKRWAKQNGMAPTYVSDVLNCRRAASDTLASCLGYRRVLRYVPERAP